MVNKLIHPQEIELYNIIPAIRRAMALEMKKRGIGQKSIALYLGVSEAAISQYSTSKRASEIKFDSGLKKEIASSVDKIIANPKSTLNEIQKIKNLPKIQKITCALHRKSDVIPKKCEICMQK